MHTVLFKFAGGHHDIRLEGVPGEAARAIGDNLAVRGHYSLTNQDQTTIIFAAQLCAIDVFPPLPSH